MINDIKMEKYNMNIESDINQLENIKNKEIDKVIKNAKKEEGLVEDSVSESLSNNQYKLKDIFDNIKNEICEPGEWICNIDYDGVIKWPTYKYKDIHISIEERWDDTVINVEWKKTKINSDFGRKSAESFSCKKDKDGNCYRNENEMTEIGFRNDKLSDILNVVKLIKNNQNQGNLNY